MSAAVRAEGDVSICNGSFDGRKIRGSEIFLPQQTVDRTGTDSAEEHPFGIYPAAFDFRCTCADENRSRSAQRDQFVGIDRQIIGCEWARILEEISGHPVILSAGRNILNLLAERAAQDLGATLARGANKSNCETRVIRHG